MALALDCPHCGVRKVETVRHAWFIQGFLLFARYGSKAHIGCDSCTRKKVITSAVISGLFGWWCFPWGLGTPFVLIQNLAAMTGPPSEAALRGLLAKQGVDMDDLVLDEHGRSRGDTRLVDGVLAALHHVTWADGDADPREIDLGTDIACRMLGDLVTPEEVQARLTTVEPPGRLAFGGLGPDAQIILMKAACAVAEADEVIEESEVEAIRDLGARLGIADDLVAHFVTRLTTQARTTEDPALLAIAAELLGVDVDAPPAEIRGAYQRLVTEAGGIADPEQGARRREELQFAYQTLLGAPAAA